MLSRRRGLGTRLTRPRQVSDQSRPRLQTPAAVVRRRYPPEGREAECGEVRGPAGRRGYVQRANSRHVDSGAVGAAERHSCIIRSLSIIIFCCVGWRCCCCFNCLLSSLLPSKPLYPTTILLMPADGRQLRAGGGGEPCFCSYFPPFHLA